MDSYGKINKKEMKAEPQPSFTCSNLKIKTLEQGVKFVQS